MSAALAPSNTSRVNLTFSGPSDPSMQKMIGGGHMMRGIDVLLRPRIV
jgi:hypothetical protein